jgi:hypothetical protein
VGVDQGKLEEDNSPGERDEDTKKIVDNQASGGDHNTTVMINDVTQGDNMV